MRTAAEVMAPTNMNKHQHLPPLCSPQTTRQGDEEGDIWQSIAPHGAGLVQHCQDQLLKRLIQMLQRITGCQPLQLFLLVPSSPHA